MKRWRKEPSASGLASVCQGVRGYQLRENGVTLIHVSPVEKWCEFRWYWYGFGINTYKKRHFDSADDAKKDAILWMKENGKYKK